MQPFCQTVVEIEMGDVEQIIRAGMIEKRAAIARLREHHLGVRRGRFRRGNQLERVNIAPVAIGENKMAVFILADQTQRIQWQLRINRA